MAVRPTHRLALLTLIASAFLALPLASANAADYTVWSCRGPDGQPASTAAWQPGITTVNGASIGSRADTCASGGSLTATLRARGTGENQPYDVAGYRLVIPAASPMTGYRVWLSATTAAASTGAYGAGLSTGTATSPIGVIGIAKGCGGTAGACTFGTAAQPLAEANLVTGTGTSTGTTLVVRCDPTLGTAGDRCTPTAPANPVGTVALHRAAITFADGGPPQVDAPAGGLIDAVGVRGPAEVHAEVTDAEGGIQRVELLIDGAVAEQRAGRGTCAEPYPVAQPCPRERRASFVVDPATLAPGDHTLAVRAYDASGAATTSPPATLRALPPVVGPPLGQAVPVQPPAAVAGGPAPSLRPGTLQLPTDPVRGDARAATVRGQLTARDGRPTGRVRLEIAQRALGAPKAAFRRVSYLTTDANGRFTLRTSPTSRELRIRPQDESVQAEPVRVEIRQDQRVRLSRVARTILNGKRVTLRGRLDGAGTASGDRLVVVEAIVRGAWRPVGTTRTRARGAVRWSYRFRRTKQAARYRFRLRVPATAGLPWGTATSRAVTVRVAP